MNQPTLFELPQYQRIVRRTDPITSVMAAKKEAKVLPSHENLVYTALVRHGKATSKELAQLSGLDYGMIHRRMSGLRKQGKAKATGIIRNNEQEWEAKIF